MGRSAHKYNSVRTPALVSLCARQQPQSKFSGPAAGQSGKHHAKDAMGSKFKVQKGVKIVVVKVESAFESNFEWDISRDRK